MSIKPVDFQVMIPRTMEVAKIANDEAQRSMAGQQQQAAASQHKAEDSLKQVYSRAHAQEARIMEKQKEDRKKDGKKKKEGSKPDSPENGRRKEFRSSSGSTIDIKI